MRFFIFQCFILIVLQGLPLFAQSVPDWIAPNTGIYEQKRPELLPIDFTYRKDIQTVQLYPASPQNQAQLLPPFLKLNDRSTLRLEFDVFGDNAPYFAARIEHCNPDWTFSNLPNLEFLDVYNEFRLNNFEFSANTKIPYVHYRFDLPRVKISGNFLLVVYEEGKKDIPVLSRRFVVYEEAVSIIPEVADITAPGAGKVMQQIRFKVIHSELPIENPVRTVSAKILQNARWDNAKELKPLYINQARQELDFSYFNIENAFLAGNEFRTLDISNFQSGGFGVRSVEFNQDKNRVIGDLDTPRNGLSFNSTFQDLNGGYYIGCATWRDAGIYSDYAEVNFFLKAAEPYEGDLYLAGAFTNWHLLPQNRFFYNPEKQQYQLQTLLKQGRYNYNYTVYKSLSEKDDTLVDGSFFQTQNDYYILFYYFPLGSRKARVVGLSSISTARN